MKKLQRLFLLCLFGITGVASWAQEECPNDEIWYTSSDGNVVTPYSSSDFGASIVSNTYSDGKGVIKFDGDVTSIDSLAFYRCSSLTSVILGNSVTSIGGRAFSGCSSLTTATLGNSVTSIGASAFYGCSSLTSINIPNSVTSIGPYAFRGCEGLTDIYVHWQTPLSPGHFVFRDVDTNRCILHVPLGTAEAYRNANVWKDFGTIVEDEEVAIESVTTGSNAKQAKKEAIYTLSEVKVSNATKGIYIIGGKKVMVK